MCGINFIQSSFEINKINIFKELDKINFFIKKNQINKILKLIRNLKRNQIYIELIEKNNQNLKKKLIQIEKKLIKKKNLSNFDLIDDVIWIVKKEILNDSKNLKKFLIDNKIKISNKSIIFFRYYFSSLESLNYLETRGRDSLGLSVNFLIKKKIDILNSKKVNNNEINFFQNKVSKDLYLVNLVLKYANPIGYAGENINKIKILLKNSKIINNVDFEDIKSFFIIGHTRWASIGEVNLSNCHPFINCHKNTNSFFYMNGDIINHDKLTSEIKGNDNFSIIDKNCKNDLKLLPNELYKNSKINIKELNGSFVLVYHQSEKPFKLSILKKGTQGLYIGNNNDENFLLSSDVYGVVNNTDKYQKVSDNKKIEINPFKVNKKTINKSDLISTKISTKDLDKKKFQNYFLKEINDTDIFLKRTINNYLDLKSKKIVNMDFLFSKKIRELLINNKVNNIIFTGMGSCYTAAVGIAKYFSEKIADLKIYNLKVQATIASEGSGFYLSNNMSNSIVIVIAQSGTTIDTNVFAKNAKNKGAYTISLVNKRDGDITHIVKSSIFLGSGRDVELSVPSTKTYTCHLYLGFILSDKIISIINNKTNKNLFTEANKIAHTNEIKQLISYHSKKINKLNVDILKFKKWIVAYDDSFNSFSALEFRIKLSECCYKSIVYIHIDNLKDSNFKDCLIFYIGKKDITNKKFIKKNFLISISTNKSLRKNNTKNFNLKNSKGHLLIIESSLAIQLVAYKMSSLIDKYSVKGVKNLNNKKLINFLLDERDKKIYLKLSKKSKINFLSDKLKRPIDAIKHQAKTVTVGAIRESKKLKKIKDEKIKIKKNQYFFKNKFLGLNKKINLFSENKYDIEKYFFGNLIEYYNNEYKKNYFYNFLNSKKYEDLKDFFQNIEFCDKNKSNAKNSLFINSDKLGSHEIIKRYLINDKKHIIDEIKFLNAKKNINKQNVNFDIDFKKYFKKFNNIKFLGSGINYLVAKKYALIFSKKFNIPIGFDVIENHKHIDISSEPLLVIFSSNIYRSGFQEDVVSEIEKFIAHNNSVIIFTNRGNNNFEKFLKSKFCIKIINLPRVSEIYSLSLFESYFQKKFFRL